MKFILTNQICKEWPKRAVLRIKTCLSPSWFLPSQVISVYKHLQLFLKPLLGPFISFSTMQFLVKLKRFSLRSEILSQVMEWSWCRDFRGLCLICLTSHGFSCCSIKPETKARLFFSSKRKRSSPGSAISDLCEAQFTNREQSLVNFIFWTSL